MKSFFRSDKFLSSSHLLRSRRVPDYQSTGIRFALREYHDDGRKRLSAFWVPTGGITPTEQTKEDHHSLLIRAGFVRQAHSGLFQFLPLGLRVQEKIESLLDKHMLKLGASKLSLSAFSSEDLWRKTGRLESSSAELFRLQDRKGGKYLLSPTHEEEVTSLVGNIVTSYRELPLRLYQISRKYRDEPRPRQGLLRTKEFLMKDLYTFDATVEHALQTYEAVRQAYDSFFRELKIPYLTAKASSGEIGGNISHEYHFPSKNGEDNLVCCKSCDYVVNEELAESKLAQVQRYSKDTEEEVPISQGIHGTGRKQRGPSVGSLGPEEDLDEKIESWANKGETQWLGISRDRNTLVHASLPREVEIQATEGKTHRKTEINTYAIKRIFPEIDLGAEDPLGIFKAERSIGIAGGESRRPSRILRIWDMRCLLHQPPPDLFKPFSVSVGDEDVPAENYSADSDIRVDLVRVETGDPCPNCGDGALRIESAVELGHTFNLGTRYSTPLEAMIDAYPSQEVSQHEASVSPSRLVSPSQRTPIQMGCHGIGVSRLVAAVADFLADQKGLNWPRIIAPFEAIIIATKGSESEAAGVYDMLTTSDTHCPQRPIDAILDDRKRDFGWKMKDADLIGYPLIVVLGRSWKTDRKCEVQCRRLGIKESVSSDDLKTFVKGLLQQL